MRHLRPCTVLLILLLVIPLHAFAGTVESGGGGFGGGGAGDASFAEQQTQTGHLSGIETVLGTTGDNEATQGSTGSVSAKLRTLTGQLNNLAGYVDGIESLIGTTNASLANRGNELGATNSAAASVGGDGSITAKLRLMTSQLNSIKTAAEELDSSVPAAAALADGTSNPTTTGFAAYNMCFNGTTWDRCTGTSTLHYATSAASTNATNIKNAAGTVSTISVVNTTATLYYLRMYNLASAPTCSSATGFVHTIPIPASTSGAGIVIPITVPHAYTTGIGYCLTGGGSSTDNTNAATGVYISIWYK